ncbi:hypothetical protein RMCBS344292_01092 [Rhizopus microsporus]|nr:hypothetical protein RMCBS344292_01092 [Rhizopus microsporus]
MNPNITTANENQYLKQIKSSKLTKKKRARATPDQVSVLEGVFAINISPNSKLRRQLAEQLNMNERSVQIWFQNKRAKIKNLQKKARLQQDTTYLPSPKTLSSSFMLSFQKDIPFQFTTHSQQYFPQSTISINHAPPYCNSLVNPPSVYSSSNVTPSLHRYSSEPASFKPVQIPVQRCSSYFELLTGTRYNQANVESNLCLAPPLSPSPDESANNSTFIRQLTETSDEGNSNNIMFTKSVDLGDSSSNSQSTDYETNKTVATDTHDNSFSKTAVTGMPLDHRIHEITPPLTENAHRDPDNLFTNNPTLLPFSYNSNTNCHLSASSLSIGTWHRFGIHASHLTCLYDSGQHSFIWYVTDSTYHFKMQIPLASIRLIEFVKNSFSARHTDQTGIYQDQSDVHFHMCQPPLFYMRYLSNKGTNSDRWTQCSDFTENKQASNHFRHTIKGETEAIRQDILQLCHVHEDVRKLIRFVDNHTPSGQTIPRLDSLPSMPVYSTHGLCPPTPSHYGLPSFPTLSTSRIPNEEFLII